MNRYDNHTIFEQATNNAWRIEHIVHLGSMLGASGVAASLEQLLAGWHVGEIIPALGLPTDATNWPVDDIASFLRRQARLGFLVQIATPVKHYASHLAFTSNWRTYRTEWVYDEDFNQIASHAAAWVQKMDDVFRAASLGMSRPPATTRTSNRSAPCCAR
jgi:hypothetical protein